MDTTRLGPEAASAIAALAARAVLDPPSGAEIAKAFGTEEQPAEWLGDPERAVVATARSGDAGFVRFLAVDPAARGVGVGRALLEAAEAGLRTAGARTVTVGADAPWYLWPGVDTRELAMVCLLERCKYTRVDANLNMHVDLGALPRDPGGWRAATPADRAAVDEWAARHWGFWRAEMLRAVDQGGLVIGEDADGLAAVCAHDVNRAGLVGPVAVRPDLLGHGAGVAPLLGALHRMRASGRTHVEIAWVGPVVPYARVGATLGRVFLVYRKELP